MTPREMEKTLRAQGYSRKGAKTAVAAMRLTGTIKEQPKQNLIKKLYKALTTKGE